MTTNVRELPRRIPVATNRAQEDHASLSAMLVGIDVCLRRWKAARHEGQAVLTGLSNALLLRTYVDKDRDALTGDSSGGGEIRSSQVWGALANAGTAVSRVSVATEARVRHLHGGLSNLQDAMVAAATELRRHAQEARRRSSLSATMVKRHHPVVVAGGVNISSSNAAAAAAVVAAMSGELEIAAALAEDDARDDGDRCDYDNVTAIGGGYGLVDVADAASEVADMFLKEALVTATVAQGVVDECRNDARDKFMAYVAAWTMQPYIDDRRVKELEVMVGRRRGRGRS